MDTYTVAAVDHLRAHPGVTRVRFRHASGAPIASVIDWETRHRPHVLPDDLKAFLCASDGFSLEWDAHVGAVPRRALGKMTLNGLERIVPLPLDAGSPPDDRCAAPPRDAIDGGVIGRAVADVVPPPWIAAEKDRVRWRPPRVTRAFDLDASCACGRVALVFVDLPECQDSHASDTSILAAATRPRSEAQVWFQDLGARWHVAAGSFSEYFRTMATNLGAPNWQLAFTDVGPDPVARQWRAFLKPERMMVDLERSKRRGPPEGAEGRGTLNGDVAEGRGGGGRNAAAAAAAAGR